MGDTCSLTFEIRTADLEKFKELARKYLGGDDFNEEMTDGNRTDLTFEEVNYGLYEEISNITFDPEVVPFRAFQGMGSGYGPGNWVCLGPGENSFRDVNLYGDLCVNYNRETYKVDDEELCTLQTFLDRLKAFDALIK